MTATRVPHIPAGEARIADGALAHPPPDGVTGLIDAVQRLSMAAELADVQRVVRTTARGLVGADGATVVLRDGDQCFYADEDAISPLWKGKRFPMSACISGWSMLNRRSVAIVDIYADERIPADAYRPTFVHSLAMVPIRSHKPVGAIGTYWADQHQTTEIELSLLQSLADATAVALENLSLSERLLTDELTGVCNRRGFFDHGKTHLACDRENGTATAVVFADLDGLKAINDERGHDAGDEAIGEAARALRAAYGEAAVIGRLGGDEFGVCATLSAPGPSAQEQIARVFETLSLGDSGAALSLGLVVSGPAGTETLDQLLARADDRMYVAKEAATAGRRSKVRRSHRPLAPEREWEPAGVEDAFSGG